MVNAGSEAGPANRAAARSAYTRVKVNPHGAMIRENAMKVLSAATLSIALLSIPALAGAETFSFEGNIASSRTVVRIPITLANPLSGVVIWTDSHDEGEHFDPITALWRDGVLLGENDDRSGLMPGQSWYDSGLTFDGLPAGNYLLTITNYYNFANSRLLADGFRFDDPLFPASNLANCFGTGNCPGNFWRVHLQDGFLPPAIPEPAHALLLATGTALLAALRRRRR